MSSDSFILNTNTQATQFRNPETISGSFTKRRHQTIKVLEEDFQERDSGHRKTNPLGKAKDLDLVCITDSYNTVNSSVRFNEETNRSEVAKNIFTRTGDTFRKKEVSGIKKTRRSIKMVDAN